MPVRVAEQVGRRGVDGLGSDLACDGVAGLDLLAGLYGEIATAAPETNTTLAPAVKDSRPQRPGRPSRRTPQSPRPVHPVPQFKPFECDFAVSLASEATQEVAAQGFMTLRHSHPLPRRLGTRTRTRPLLRLTQDRSTPGRA